MITLTRIDGTKFILNADEIEIVESQHESCISTKSGKKYIVVETSEEIVRLVVQYKRLCYNEIMKLSD
ncbi:MAG: flagellar FlbD family protein [Candidatus Kapabacteria bacterium]|nr:flagellar FlbD family protein [Candidatus Kapabacteria bacterium]